MARKPRKDFAGAWHHVVNRGAGRRPVFLDDEDRSRFLDILGESVDKYSIELHTYSLMTNHYHLFSRSVLGNVSRAMQYLGSTYTLYFNARHGTDGPLFRGRFRNQIVSNSEYQRYLVAYIHLNPVKAGLVHRPSDAVWCGHPIYLGREPAPAWMTTEYLLRLFGSPAGLDAFVTNVYRGALEPPGAFEREGDGWLANAPSEPVLDLSDEVEPPVHDLPPTRQVRYRPPDAVLREACRLTGATVEDLRIATRGRAANPARRFAAWALRRTSLCTYGEVGRLLDMPYNQVVRLLSRIRKGERGPDLTDWIDTWLALEPVPGQSTSRDDRDASIRESVI